MHSNVRALYVCYLSLEDPLVETQVLAYLDGLASRGHAIHLITYDGRLGRRRRQQHRKRLASRGIAWHGLRYHKRPSLPATVYDVLRGAAFAYLLMRRHRLHVLHARSHVPATLGLIIGRFRRIQLVFDVRGLMAEEYADAGRWRRDGMAFRITKRVERLALRQAASVVVLTERVRNYLFGEGESEKVTVIPCCADLERLERLHGRRSSMREHLGLQRRTVLVYVGKFTGWYMEREMIDFFDVARGKIDDLFFLVLTQSEPSLIVRELEARNVVPSDYLVTTAAPEEVAAYLAASDLAIAFIRPVLSKISSSPTKVGEYLGAGLPVISTRGVGDLDELLGPDVGVLVDELDARGLERAVDHARELLSDPLLRDRCLDLARRQLSLERVGIPRYDAVYRLLATERREGRET